MGHDCFLPHNYQLIIHVIHSNDTTTDVIEKASLNKIRRIQGVQGRKWILRMNTTKGKSIGRRKCRMLRLQTYSLKQWFLHYVGSRRTVNHIKLFWRTSCTKLKIYFRLWIKISTTGFILILKIFFHNPGTPSHLLRCTDWESLVERVACSTGDSASIIPSNDSLTDVVEKVSVSKIISVKHTGCSI
jgi:hypothetical protein